MRFLSKHKSYSIRHVLLACISSILLFTCFVLLFYYYGFINETKKQLHASFALLSAEKEEYLQENFDGIIRAAKMVGYSIPMQEYLLSDDSSIRLQNLPAARAVLDYALGMNPAISDIFVYTDKNTHLYSSSFRKDLFLKSIAAYEITENLDFKKGFFSDILYDREDSSPYVFYFLPVYNSLPFQTDSKIHTVCAVLFDMNSMISFNHKTGKTIAAAIYKNQLISTSRSISKLEEDLILSLSEDQDTLQIGKEKYFSNLFLIPNLDYSFIYMVNEQDLMGDALSRRNSVFILLLMGTCLITGIMLLAVRSIITSLNQVIQDVNSLHAATSPFEVRTPREEELKELSITINQMLDRIEKTTRNEQEAQKNLYEAILSQKHAEMLAYRSQINPHFLFNTLECMRSMAQYYTAIPLVDLISAMSSMFRYSLYSGITTRLEEEVNHVIHYFHIISSRFPDQYRMKVSMGENTKSAQCLSMILQPLAENTILHAFHDYSKAAPCTLCIQTRMDTSRNILRIRLSDNGTGMTPTEVEALNILMRKPEHKQKHEKQDSIGIPNIFKRLKLAYGQHCHLRIYSKKGFYTTIEISIPQGELKTLYKDTN